MTFGPTLSNRVLLRLQCEPSLAGGEVGRPAWLRRLSRATREVGSCQLEEHLLGEALCFSLSTGAVLIHLCRGCQFAFSPSELDRPPAMSVFSVVVVVVALMFVVLMFVIFVVVPV
jgi:hypothetical protein